MTQPLRVHGRRLAGAAALVLFAGFTTEARAVSSRTWKQRDRADFEQGDPRGVALLSEGPIRLGARLDKLFEPDQPYIWAVAPGPNGIVYAAGGNEGLVYRLEPGKNGTPFLQVEEPEVQALAVDGQGAIYAGSSPGGHIYKFNPDGTRAWRTDTGEKYIWALLFDRQGGTLFAGTGTDGRILALDREGKSRVLFDSSETHIRCLALDREGVLLAGTDGHGLVLRIPPDGKGQVLYDAPLAEVVALQPGPDGVIYAAVAGEGGRSSRPSSSASSPRSEGGDNPGSSKEPPSQDSSSSSSSSSSSAESRLSVAMEGKVLAISADGYAREVWSASQEAILSMAPLGNGAFLFGSSSQGKLYAFDPKGTISEIGRSESSQVTALLPRHAAARGPDEVIVAGSNLGSVDILKPGYVGNGHFESKVFDAQSFATWGRIAWRADLPSGTSVAVQTRSGNTEDPDRTWSEWSGDLNEADGAKIPSPGSRFMQWRATLATKDPAHSPELREVAVVYMQKNLPPEFRKIEVLQPGVSMQAVPAQSPADSKPSGTDGDSATRHRPKPTSRRSFEAGARTITWQASDPNDDDMTYDVQYRALDEKNWKTVRRGIDEDFVTFDGATLPDGTYLVRVIASDAPSNPAGQSLTAERISQPFDVDNTPPRIERLKAVVEKGSLKVTFAASDGFSVVREAAYSINAGEWVPARAEDGLSDSQNEAYDVDVPTPPSGECSIVVRAVDAAGNIGSGRTVVDIP
jgi:outer membrane protein assembly factor BamB